MKPIRVLIVDDHALFRSGIRLLLQHKKPFEVVGEAANGQAGAHLVRSLRPDVVLLDLHMPGISGGEALQMIVAQTPETRVVMLTASEDREEQLACMRAGATGYLLKFAATEHLTNAIICAARGESFIGSQARITWTNERLQAGVRQGAKRAV